MITGSFAITLHGEFLPIQLTYGGKTVRSFPWYNFPKDFSLRVNPKHFLNTSKYLKFLKDIIKSYAEKKRKTCAEEKCWSSSHCWCFTGQMTTKVINGYEKANILIVNVPTNMTKYYQPLDLTVNGFAKSFLKRNLRSNCRLIYLESFKLLSKLSSDTLLALVNSEMSRIRPAGW